MKRDAGVPSGCCHARSCRLTLGFALSLPLLLSGTTGANAESIVTSGFLVGGRDIPAVHGSSFGVGVYASEWPLTAMGSDQTARRAADSRRAGTGPG